MSLRQVVTLSVEKLGHLVSLRQGATASVEGVRHLVLVETLRHLASPQEIICIGCTENTSLLSLYK